MKSGFLLQEKEEKEYSLAGPLKDNRSLGSQWSHSMIGGSNGSNARNGGGWGCSQTKTKDGWKSTSKSHGWRDSIEDHSSEKWNKKKQNKFRGSSKKMVEKKIDVPSILQNRPFLPKTMSVPKNMVSAD